MEVKKNKTTTELRRRFDTPECKLQFLVAYQEEFLALSNVIMFSSVVIEAICETEDC